MSFWVVAALQDDAVLDAAWRLLDRH